MPRLLFAFVAEETKPKKSGIQLPFLILSGDPPNAPAEPMLRRVYREKERAREGERARARASVEDVLSAAETFACTSFDVVAYKGGGRRERRKGKRYVCVCICVHTDMVRGVPVDAHHMVCGVERESERGRECVCERE